MLQKHLVETQGGVKMAYKQGYNDRMDESLGMRNKGKKKQSYKARRDESKGMEKAKGKKAYSSVGSMDKHPEHSLGHSLGHAHHHIAHSAGKKH